MADKLIKTLEDMQTSSKAFINQHLNAKSKCDSARQLKDANDNLLNGIDSLKGVLDDKEIQPYKAAAFKEGIDPKLIDLSVKQCNLIDNIYVNAVKLNNYSEKLLECYNKLAMEDKWAIEGADYSILALDDFFPGKECRNYMNSCKESIREAEELSQQKTYVESQIQSFCQLTGHNNNTIEACNG